MIRPWDDFGYTNYVKPRTEVHNVLNLSSLGSLRYTNSIIHRVRKLVKYVRNGNRICLTNNLEPTCEGILFVASTKEALHLLVYPLPENLDGVDGLRCNVKRQTNINSITNHIENAYKWVPASFWGDNGYVIVQPPSESIVAFKPTSRKFEPQPGMDSFISDGVGDLWGHLAHDTTHEDYRKMVGL